MCSYLVQLEDFLCLSLHVAPYFVGASSEGSVQTGHIYKSYLSTDLFLFEIKFKSVAVKKHTKQGSPSL